MKPLIALLALLLISAAPPRPCPQPTSEFNCAIGDRNDLQLGRGIVTVERIILISGPPLERPLAVRVAGLASAEAYWNGRLIGRNGVPGRDRASEIPGDYFASFAVPSALVRPGANQVTVRLSGEHLWLPVQRPIHILDVGLYETPELPGRSLYLPALLALGAIAFALLYFLFAALGGGTRGAALVAGFALAALLQLLAEVSRAFIVYTYPWALGRVTIIAFLAAASAVAMAAYAAGRFLPDRRWLLVAATAIGAAASLLLIPSFDFKAMGALLSGAVALAVAAAFGLRRGIDGARWAAAASLVTIAAMAWEVTAFLDMAWHLIAAALLILLVLEQVGQLRAARVQAARAEALEERLRKAEEAGEPIVQLKDGSRVHRVAQGDILFARGADDYCEVRLKDGRTLLVTTGLARLQTALPAGFVRVHKSYVVNGDQVRRLEPKPGGGRLLRLDGEVTVPVGRSYGPAVSTWAR